MMILYEYTMAGLNTLKKSLSTLTTEYNITTAVLTSDISILLILVSSDPMSANLLTVWNNVSILRRRFQTTEDPFYARLCNPNENTWNSTSFLVINRRAAVTVSI